MKKDSEVTVKAYGIALHPRFLEIQCPQDQLIEGGKITIRNQIYKIVSVVKNASDQYSINVALQF